MGRTRLIKPELTLDEELSELGFAARYFFINLWTHCDKDGRCEDRPKMLQAKILPWDFDVDANILLDELHPKFVFRYEIGGKRFLQVRNFSRHQHPHPKEPESIIPKPQKDLFEKPCKNIARNVLQCKKTARTSDSYSNTDSNSNSNLTHSRKEMAVGPKAPASPKPESNIQKVVNAYKIAKNISKDDKAWDRSNYPRYSKAAKSILEAFSSVEQAVAYIIVKGDEFNSKDISWTLETLSRHAHDDKGKLNDQPHSKMGTNNILELGRPKELSQDRGNGGGGEREVVGFLEEKDHFGSGIIPGFPKAKQG